MLIAALCIAASQAAIWSVQYRTGVAAAQAATFEVAGLPLQLGEWTGASAEIDPMLARAVGAISLIDRRYENDAGRRASVHLATFPTAEVTLPHPPDLCYTGGGWTILNDEWQRDTRDRQYRLMVVEQEGARSAVVYWYQLGSDVASNRDELRKILQKRRLEGKGWPPLVKVLIQVPIHFSGDDFKPAAEDLGARIYEWIKTNS